MSKRLMILVSLMLVLVLALGACGGRDEPVAEAPAAAAPLAEAPAAPLAEAPAPTEVPVVEEAVVEEVAEEPVEEVSLEAADSVAVLDGFASNIPDGFLATGKIDDVKAAMENGALLIDVREEGDFAEGHIPGAINIPIRTVTQNLDKIPTDRPVLVYCGSGLRAGQALVGLQALGYENVKSFPGSWRAWTAAEEEVSTEAVEAETFELPEIDAATLAMAEEFFVNLPDGYYGVGDVTKLDEAVDAGAFLLDVREAGEFADGAIPGALNIPIRDLMQNLDQVPQDQPVVVYCASGHRASMATALLHMAGYDNVRVFMAGYGAWEAAHEVAGEAPAVDTAAAGASDTAVVDAVATFLAEIPDGFYSAGNAEKMVEMIDATNPLLIDVREESEYAAGHIPGAINIPIRTLAANLDKIPADTPVVVYCASGHRAGQAMVALQLLGYDNVKSFAGGWRAWSTAGLEASTEATAAEAAAVVAEPDPAMLAAVDEFLVNLPDGFFAINDVEAVAGALEAGALAVDVREPSEFDEGHIAGAINIPIRSLGENLDQLPTDAPIILYCASGHRSAISTAALQVMGYTNVRAFPPAYGAWENAGEATE